MLSLLGIVVAVAAVLAVVVASLVIGVCLAIAWVSDAVRGHPRTDARATVFPAAGGRRRDGSGAHAASRRGGR